MSHISGTFSHPLPGKLRVTLSGTFFQGTARDAGFPSGPSNYLLRGVVNGNNTEPIDRYAPFVSLDLDYPGGNVSWAVSTATVATATNGSIATYGFTNLRMALQLLKK